MWTLDAFVNYHSWQTGLERKYICKMLGTTDYFVRKTRTKENEDLNKLARRKFVDIIPEPETTIEKLAWWIYSNNLDWQKFGKKYIKTIKLNRWLYLRRDGFRLLDESAKKEIEIVTNGLIKVGDWPEEQSLQGSWLKEYWKKKKLNKGE